MVAGYETTVHLDTNIERALLNKPSQLQAVREDSTLIANTVNELLRYDGPVDIPTPRYSTTEIALVHVVRHRNEVVLTHCYRPTASRTGSRMRVASASPRVGTRYTSLRRSITGSDRGCTAVGGLLERFDDLALDHTATLVAKTQ